MPPMSSCKKVKCITLDKSLSIMLGKEQDHPHRGVSTDRPIDYSLGPYRPL